MKYFPLAMSCSIVVLIFGLLLSDVVNSAESRVKSDYLEVFTGAGRGYPIFFVIEKNKSFTLLKQKTDWIKIKSGEGQVGWINYNDYASAVYLAKPNLRQQVIKSSWELGLSAGTFGSDRSYSAVAGYQIKPVIAVQVEMKKVIGKFSHSNLVSGQLMLQPFRQLLVNPFISIGMGRMQNVPRNSLVNAVNTQTNVYQYGGGLNYIPYKRLNLRLSIKNYYLDKSEKSYLDVHLGMYALFG